MLKSLYEGFSASLDAKTGEIAATMAGALTAPLTAALTLYIILYGIGVMRGAIQEPVLDFAVRGIKLAIIWSLVSSAGDYATWVSSVINTVIPDLVVTITGGDPGLPSDPVMIKADQIATEVQELYEGSGISGIPTTMYGYFMSGVVYAFASFFAAIAFVATLLSHFGLSVLAAIGPLFICFALFDFSRGWFFAWLGTILNFALVKLLVIVLTVTVTAFMGDVYTKIDLAGGMAALIGFVVALLCATILFFLVPSIAASLSAGSQASTGMLQRFVERRLGGRGKGGGGGGGGGANKL